MRAPAVLAFALSLLAACPPAGGQERRGEPGAFDYYLLSLSWSPTHCAGEEGGSDPQQCAPGRRFGFVVHGLWPQYERGGWPRECRAARDVPRDVVERVLPIMPSRTLIEHQWRKHGSCSGYDARRYFDAVRAAFERVRIPETLRRPDRAQALAAADVVRLFALENPGLEPNMVAVTCRRRELTEVRICLDRNLTFRRCGREVEDRCPRGTVTVRPVR